MCSSSYPHTGMYYFIPYFHRKSIRCSCHKLTSINDALMYVECSLPGIGVRITRFLSYGITSSLRFLFRFSSPPPTENDLRSSSTRLIFWKEQVLGRLFINAPSVTDVMWHWICRKDKHGWWNRSKQEVDVAYFKTQSQNSSGNTDKNRGKYWDTHLTRIPPEVLPFGSWEQWKCHKLSKHTFKQLNISHPFMWRYCNTS